MDVVSKKMFNCGDTDGFKQRELMTFSEFLVRIVQDGLVLGRFATEIVREKDFKGKELIYFRPVDAGTIYRIVPKAKKDQNDELLRKQSKKLLQSTKVQPVNIPMVEKEEFAYAQVINGIKRQVFTEKELVVTNLYPSNDVELNGYPVTPIDKVIADILTHINITTHNKLYFQSGRAARGMLIINSNAIDDETLEDLRQQFNASINGVARITQNASVWRRYGRQSFLGSN